MNSWISSSVWFSLALIYSANGLEVRPSQGKHWQGDIVLTPGQKMILSGAARTSNTGLLSLANRWPKIGGYVWIPYMFDPASKFSAADKAFIAKDLRTLEKKTCVRFPIRRNQADYIRIINDEGCYSSLGMLRGMQDISLQNPGCVNDGTPVHEFIHAIGFDHMHSHIDRDQFLTIHFENIAQDAGTRSQFDKVDPKLFGNFNTTFDYYSVMEYGRKDFSINGQDVIVPTNSSYLNIIGQNKISPGDIARINNMHNC